MSQSPPFLSQPKSQRAFPPSGIDPCREYHATRGSHPQLTSVAHQIRCRQCKPAHTARFGLRLSHDHYCLKGQPPIATNSGVVRMQHVYTKFIENVLLPCRRCDRLPKMQPLKEQRHVGKKPSSSG